MIPRISLLVLAFFLLAMTASAAPTKALKQFKIKRGDPVVKRSPLERRSRCAPVVDGFDALSHADPRPKPIRAEGHARRMVRSLFVARYTQSDCPLHRYPSL
ncbi:hypothetical protein BV25DRAFT_1827321 [Artomyces pyxidatus]|uniref:Uncharacterized protein n=1 Tax=Artomyces pyxidatus TaxID=48021 RepID=A0ACB8SXZ1_9AGAM|nr:hypothetical protein BV25DRAFT_1827321 [Artomyces pyxidatus]